MFSLSNVHVGVLLEVLYSSDDITVQLLLMPWSLPVQRVLNWHMFAAIPWSNHCFIAPTVVLLHQTIIYYNVV